MSFLLSSDWLLDEAAELRIVIPEATVRRSFDKIRNQQFRKPGEFKSFLRTSGETVADLMFRVRLNLLSTRVQKHFLADQHSARARARALAKFVRTFKSKWMARTYCTVEVDVSDCGHLLPAPATAASARTAPLLAVKVLGYGPPTMGPSVLPNAKITVRAGGRVIARGEGTLRRRLAPGAYRVTSSLMPRNGSPVPCTSREIHIRPDEATLTLTLSCNIK